MHILFVFLITLAALLAIGAVILTGLAIFLLMVSIGLAVEDSTKDAQKPTPED